MIFSCVLIEIKSSEIRLTFSIIVLTLETTYPPASFSSLEEILPGIEELGLPLPIVKYFQMTEFFQKQLKIASDAFRPP